MKRFFLYRLFKESKAWFIFSILFLVLYLFFFMKKMDTVFTPYNGMFAFVNNKPDQTSTIAMKLDGKAIVYTNKLWWKKDFFENTIAFYSRYMLNAKKVALNDYIQQKPFSESQKEFLSNRLTPDSFLIKSYASWLLNFADEKVQKNSTIEIIKYDFEFLDNKLLLKDSISLFKTQISDAEVIY